MAKQHKSAPFSKNHYEYLAWKAHKCVVGIDEVGRGCLAGPLVAGAVILPQNTSLSRLSRTLKDSKVLSESEREQAYSWIIRSCQWAIGVVNHRIVDQHNVYQATFLAMKRALLNLLAQTPCSTPLDAILVDAMPITLTDTSYAIPVHNFPKGEQWSGSIAAASIIAKVTRDRMMQQLNQHIPGYHLDLHKGYATKAHQSSLESHGHSLIHRLSFLRSFSHNQKVSRDRSCQQRIC